MLPEEWTIDENGNYTLDGESSYTGSVPFGDDTPSTITITENGVWTYGSEESPIENYYLIQTRNDQTTLVIDGQVTAYSNEYGLSSSSSDETVNIGENANITFNTENEVGVLFISFGDLTSESFSGVATLNVDNNSSIGLGLFASNISIGTLDGSISVNRISATDDTVEGVEINSAISTEVPNILEGTPGNVDITTLSGTVSIRTDNNSTNEDVLAETEDTKTKTSANKFSTTQSTIYGGEVTIGTLSGTVNNEVETTVDAATIDISAAAILAETSIAIDELSGAIVNTVEIDSDSGDYSTSIEAAALTTENDATDEITPSITISSFGSDASITSNLYFGDLVAYNTSIDLSAISSYNVTIGDIYGSIATTFQSNSLTITSDSYVNTSNCFYGINSDNYIITGDINGSISSTIDLETLTSSNNSNMRNYSMLSDSDITLGDISETGSISSVIDIAEINSFSESNHYYNNIYSVAIDSNGTMTTGDIAGTISASSNVDLFNNGEVDLTSNAIESKYLTIGDVSGTISAISTIDSIDSEYADESSNYYSSVSTSAEAIEGRDLNIENITGDITATASIGNHISENASYVYGRASAIALNFENAVINSISGNISATSSVGETTATGAESVVKRAYSYAIEGEGLTLTEDLPGSITATATIADVSTDNDYASNHARSYGIRSYGTQDISGTAEGSLISAISTVGNITYSGEEDLTTDYYGMVDAIAYSAGSGSLGTLNGDIIATATLGSGYDYAYAIATGLCLSGYSSYSDKNSTLARISWGYDSDSTITIDAINGNITVLADTSASNSDLSGVIATGIEIEASTTSSDSEETENYIGSISGIIDVTANVGSYYGFNGYVSVMGISSSSYGGIYKTTSSKLISEDDDDSSTIGLDLHIGTLDGSFNVTTEVGNGTGVNPFKTIGIQGITGEDECSHNLNIDTLSGNVTVNSTIGVTTFEMVEDDLDLIDTLLSYDYLPLNVAVGITDSSFDTDLIMYDYSYDLKDSEINIGDLSGSIIVNATTLAVDFSDYAANYVEEGEDAPTLYQVYTEVAGISTNHSDVNITDFSGDVTVSVTTPELEEGQEVQNGTVVVSGITAKGYDVNIEDFIGDITVSGTIEGEGTVVATGISASEISGNYAGNISVTSDDYAIGMILWNEPEEATDTELASSEFTIDGTLSAEGTEGQTYAIYAGYFDYEEVANEDTESKTISLMTSDYVEKELVLVAGESDETVNITTNASITGAIDLTGGNDTINLVDSSSVETTGVFSTDIYNVEALNVLSGTWSFDNDYDYSTVTINGGTLTYAVDADIEGITLTSGVLATTAGTLSNIGTLSAGTFQVSETGTWSELTLDGATLDLQRGYDLNSDTITYTSGTILLNGSETDTYNWGISTITTGQTVTLNNGLFKSSTDVTVDGGSFVFNGGSIDLNYNTYDFGDFTVPEGGTVYGIGTIVGDVTNNGTIIPGYSPGTISISGDFYQSETGTLVMEISGSDYDVINVSGTATVDGTLDLTTADLENNTEYTLIASTEDVQGEFDDIVIQATRTTEVTYDLNAIYVEVTHKSYTEFVQNNDQGQYTIGNTLDQVFDVVDTHSLLGDLITKVDSFMLDSNVTEFLEQLAAPMSMNTGWLVEQGSDIMNLIKDQQAQTPAGSYVWAKAIREHMDFDSYTNYGERNGDYNGAVAGFALQVGDSNWTLGGSVSGIDGSLDNQTLSKYDNETTSLWLLATHYMVSENDGWSQAFRMGLGYSDVDVDAYDRFFFNGDHINSSYKGETLSGFFEVAANKQFSNWKIEPSIGFTFQRHTDDAHNDMLNGEVLRTWEDVSSKSIKGTVGCRAMYVIEMASAKLIPYVNARFEYQFEDQPEGNFTWGGTSISGTLESAEWDEQTLRLGAGLMYLMDSGWSTSVSGDYLEGDSHNAYGVNAGFSYSF